MNENTNPSKRRKCGNYLFVHYACFNIFFQYNYELFLTGGGDGVCAKRNDYGEG